MSGPISIAELTLLTVKTCRMPPFVPGIELNRDFYSTIVGPILTGRAHAAGLLGWGSDVLGFDDERSTDHGRGLRLLVFVEAAEVENVRQLIDQNLPAAFRERPVRYGWDAVPVQHHVNVSTLDDWLIDQFGFSVGAQLTTEQWLLAPQQRLLGITAGAVYHDSKGELNRVRSQLARFPDDVRMWMIASAVATRFTKEEAFVGRSIETGDHLGSRLVCGRLARELMRLWFLFHRTYWPYQRRNST